QREESQEDQHQREQQEERPHQRYWQKDDLIGARVEQARVRHKERNAKAAERNDSSNHIQSQALPEGAARRARLLAPGHQNITARRNPDRNNQRYDYSRHGYQGIREQSRDNRKWISPDSIERALVRGGQHLAPQGAHQQE